MSFWMEVLAIFIAVVMAGPIEVILGELAKDYLSYHYGWFRGHRASQRMADSLDTFIRKLKKKKGRKRLAKQIEKIQAQEKEETKNVAQ